ncbi:MULTISPECIES: hypothetical protein [unclassified Anabaena]|uniref:hypothetical protein n=1 Tax=unclassified Anabaena TaxID=2619674 RepID=UPI0039C6A041
MAEITDLGFHRIDTELLIQDITPRQAETLLGGYWQPHEDYPYAYIINITKNPSQAETSQPEIKSLGTVSNKKEINSIDNSRKTYVNGVPIKGERNIIIAY